MTRRAALTTAILLGVAAGAGAAWAAPPIGGPISAVAVDQKPARPAESGARDTAATLGPLAIGALVRDRVGARIGHITLLTTDASGRDIAKVRNDEDVFSIPVADLYARDGGALSMISLAELQRSYAAP